MSKTKARRCQVSTTDWPVIPGEPAPVAACWTHLSEEERESCSRARKIRNAERARAWAEEEPERQRQAAEAEAERLARIAACPCDTQLPDEAGTRSTGYAAPNRCKRCGSWLCASCDRVRVEAEGLQCKTCRPPASKPAQNGDAAPQDSPHYQITVGGLECFTEAVCLLIRSGARNGGNPRQFAVHLPICASQAEALEDLKTFSLGSDAGRIQVTLVPEDAKAVVDPDLPEPDLSGLGDVDSWWLAHGYPTGDRRRQP
ncbi:hypothetical protein R1T08_02375 [Streptomyces sp. SBC-4]|nr:hypothetical protein [Streptomyces sp. SBC-4]MDV5143183.1 hypothetical protein [Streptomyces sp. SBC-4]